VNGLSSLFWLSVGKWCAAKGLGSLAVTCYGYAAQAGSGEAWFRLGQNQLDNELPAKALESLLAAVKAAPNEARIWNSLGAAQRRCARMQDARESYERALVLNPTLCPALNNLGEWLLVQGSPEEALPYFERVLELAPTSYEALGNRVAALLDAGRRKEAEVAARAAVACYPDRAPLQVNLGNALLHSGDMQQAVSHYRRALEIDPGCEEAHLNMALWSGDSGHMANAIDYLRDEIDLKGESASRLSALALAQQTKGEISRAEASCRRALELQPGHVSALITLAGCLSARGDHRGANELHLQAVAANPNLPSIASNVLFNLTYLPDEPAASVFEAHRDWASRFELPLADRRFTHPPGGGGDRKLRIGYVSGDFNSHPVGFLLRDVLGRHDPAHFEVHCYSMVRKDDEITRTLREAAHVWHDEALADDAALAAQVYEDRIDVLVDLSGHTAFNRLTVFALRPAPVQATWIGYFHSTGLQGIDYFITDPHTSPVGCGQWFSEVPVHLPHSRFCYSPPSYAPEVMAPPSTSSAAVVFGSFNRAEKLVPPVVAAWAEILRRTDNARLLLKARSFEDEGIQKVLAGQFEAHGIDRNRLDFRGVSPHFEMLGQYGDMDIALDPFPFNGGMTTLEALWMGVPVVTLAGTSVVSRQSLAVLENMGVPELIFPDLASYVAGAVALASDRDRLVRLRRELRPRLAASPVCQPEQFTRDLEALYRRMWRAWCAGTRLPSDVAVPGASGA
jgi:predicted O-linked N-acetylglucosamine transferase (SPINDLY family)